MVSDDDQETNIMIGSKVTAMEEGNENIKLIFSTMHYL